jgi:hypothetical protein
MDESTSYHEQTITIMNNGEVAKFKGKRRRSRLRPHKLYIEQKVRR